MASKPLSALDRASLESQLAEYEQFIDSPGAITDSYLLGSVVSMMGMLSKPSWHGRSYQDWNRLCDYAARTGFNRRLDISLRNIQIEAYVGDQKDTELPVLPQRPLVKLGLESIDGRRQLICHLSLVTGRPEFSQLNELELKVALGQRDNKKLWGISRLVMHFLNRQQPNPKAGHYCSVYDCVKHYSIQGIGDVEQAYETNGVRGAWHALDRVWSDSLAARPLVKPLSSASLATRCVILADRIVKVWCTDGQLVGLLAKDDADMQPRDSIWLKPALASGHNPLLVSQVRVIAADTILEMMPWRLQD